MIIEERMLQWKTTMKLNYDSEIGLSILQEMNERLVLDSLIVHNT